MAESNPRPAPKVSPDILKDVALFGGLDADSLGVLARELPTRLVETGEVVVREGDTASEMYVVIGGELEVVKMARDGSDVRVALFGPGDWFGEMSIVDVQPRSASVRSVAPTMLLRIGSEEVQKLLYERDLKAYSIFIMNIARELSRRLRVADGILAQFVTSVADYSLAKKSTPPPK
ncbi:MAG: cyclic nucleotide-binding domain-containing protein [Myxococcota bacterium]